MSEKQKEGGKKRTHHLTHLNVPASAMGMRATAAGVGAMTLLAAGAGTGATSFLAGVGDGARAGVEAPLLVGVALAATVVPHSVQKRAPALSGLPHLTQGGTEAAAGTTGNAGAASAFLAPVEVATGAAEGGGEAARDAATVVPHSVQKRATALSGLPHDTQGGTAAAGAATAAGAGAGAAAAKGLAPHSVQKRAPGLSGLLHAWHTAALMAIGQGRWGKTPLGVQHNNPSKVADASKGPVRALPWRRQRCSPVRSTSRRRCFFFFGRVGLSKRVGSPRHRSLRDTAWRTQRALQAVAAARCCQCGVAGKPLPGASRATPAWWAHALAVACSMNGLDFAFFDEAQRRCAGQLRCGSALQCHLRGPRGSSGPARVWRVRAVLHLPGHNSNKHYSVSIGVLARAWAPPLAHSRCRQYANLTAYAAEQRDENSPVEVYLVYAKKRRLKQLKEYQRFRFRSMLECVLEHRPVSSVLIVLLPAGCEDSLLVYTRRVLLGLDTMLLKHMAAESAVEGVKKWSNVLSPRGIRDSLRDQKTRSETVPNPEPEPAQEVVVSDASSPADVS